MRIRDENKVHAIRLHAIKMVSSEGIEGFGVNKLARAVGVSPGTIYIYYKDKEDLLVQLCIDVSNEILAASIKGLDPDMHFKDGLRLQWKNRFNYLKKHPLEVQFVEQLRYSPLYEKVTKKLLDEYGKVLGEFIENAVERRELVRLPFKVYWSLAFAPLYQMAKFEAQNKSLPQAFTISANWFEESLRIVLKGLEP